MENGRNDFHLLYCRPKEPLFMPKGKDNIMFDLPEEYLYKRYKPIGQEVVTHFEGLASDKISLKTILLPDLSFPMQLKRHANFSIFIEYHRKMASKLIDIFLNMPTIEDLKSCAAYARDRVNPLMFIYALTVVMIHREDTRHLPVPSIVQTFPDKFMHSSVFHAVREEARIVPEKLRRPIVIPRDFTASDLESEHRLAYFREDIGVNLHHYHWHLVYPHDSANRDIVDKDRRGELFYYMHQQVLARYNTERFCNRLHRVKVFNNFNETIEKGYFPKLNSLTSSRPWPPRQDNVAWVDVNREIDHVKLSVSDMERWRDKIYEAIHQGFCVDRTGKPIPLDDVTGIDILGNMIESSMLSPNRGLYGDMHNNGHVIASFVHDPDNSKLETFNVLGDSSVAMRDPFFYRWHAFINDMFQEFISSLPHYSKSDLDFPGVEIQSISVGTNNVLQTFWQQSSIDLANGLDFTARGSIYVTFTHLQHRAFQYRIQIINSGEKRRGTVRIFLSPKHNERGVTWSFYDQRNMMIEMDKFTINMRPGNNTVIRRSDESSVTIPFETTFRNSENRPTTGTDEAQAYNFCGCGWPDHMLIPKSSAEGIQFQLFVMVSDYEGDRVISDPPTGCSEASSYCGIRDRLYPDKRPMGYPFNRFPEDGIDTLEQFLTPNMHVQDCLIRLNNTVELNPKAPPPKH